MKLQRSIQANFSALAERMLDHVAVAGDDRRLTYGELARRSDGMARYLVRHGIRRGDRVGLYAQRSVETVTALLGILKAGAAYVPFDPSYPAKLQSFVHQDCQPALMLVQSSLLTDGHAAFWDGATPEPTAAREPRAADAPHDAAPHTASGPLTVHELHTVFDAALDEPAGAALPEIGPDDPAYIMYTSGSTGHPKGVLIPHRGVVRLVTDTTYADLGPDQVHLQLAPLAFDASTFEIWGALLNGGRLAILSAPHPSLDEVADSIARHGVTTLWLTAGLFHLMVDHRLEGLAPLRQLLAGGDVLSPTHVARAQAGLPACQLINGYGPTENTTFTCCYRIPRDGGAASAGDAPGPSSAPGAGTTPGTDGAARAPAAQPPPAIPIGTPIAHTQIYILDEARQAVADGQEGELFTGGAGVALGYWQRPELTAEKFVADPHDPSGLARLYRTGDRVRRRPDGNLEFLGRVDRQVKLNGKRVELDEIEATLRRGPAVEDAAVICPPGEVGARQVHAYVKFRRNSDSALTDLRAFLRQELPDYMNPATFTVLEALPLSPTGKIDRSKLPVPQTGAAAAGGTGVAAGAAAGNEIESLLLEIWRQILRTPSVGLDDNFFDLGGTSLQVIAVHARIVAAMKTDISVVDLFQFPSIAALAARLLRGAGAKPAVATGNAPAAGNAAGATMNADERARRQQAALARVRTNPRRNAR